MVLALPHANVTEANPYVRFIQDNSKMMRVAATEAMLARYYASREAMDTARFTLLMVRRERWERLD